MTGIVVEQFAIFLLILKINNEAVAARIFARPTGPQITGLN